MYFPFFSSLKLNLIIKKYIKIVKLFVLAEETLYWGSTKLNSSLVECHRYTNYKRPSCFDVSRSHIRINRA